jgi:hypothetical protein
MIVTMPFAKLARADVARRLHVGMTYSYVGASQNNARVPFEALNVYKRPEYSELSGTLTLPLLGERIELTSSVGGQIGKTIPISLPGTWFQLPTNRANVFLGMRVHY